jgi:hypothetical protein
LKIGHLILEPKRVGFFRSRLGEAIVINHPVGYSAQMLTERNLVDCIIVDTEDGFSQLGGMRRFLSRDLGLYERNLVQHVLDGFPETLERNISSLADWNRANPKVTLVAIPSGRPDSHLKGLILAPYDDSECYRQFSMPGYRRIHRDFMYNVTYESIAHAYKNWGAKRIGIAHLSRSKITGDGINKYHCDLTTCQVEAIVHFCNDHQGMESFTFLDDYEGNQPLEIVKELNELQDVGVHRPIVTKAIQLGGIDYVDLEWPPLPPIRLKKGFA